MGARALGSQQDQRQQVAAAFQQQAGARRCVLAGVLELGTWRSLPRRWSCAAFVPCRGVWRLPVWEQAGHINSECFSLLWSWSCQARNPLRTHAQLYGSMCGILESIHKIRVPPAEWAELEVPLEAAVVCGAVILGDDREANKAWCVDRQELFLYLTSQLLQDKHTWTYRPGLKESDVCTLLLTKSSLGLSAWIRAGYKGIGEVRPACLFLLVKSKCFLDSGVHHCCKVGHSCMRRVIDCSSVPHKMAWCSVARAIRAVARFGGPRCEFFDSSQLRPEVDRMFQELDTAPARCCWRCGLPLAGLSLITADIDQAFEACSSSAVLVKIYPGLSWSLRIMQNLGRSQSFGRGWLSFSTPVLARALFSFTSVSLVVLGSMVWQNRGIPIGGVMSSAAVAVSSLGQQPEHSRLGFNFQGRPIRSCISWRRYVDDVLVGSRVFCLQLHFCFYARLLPSVTLVSLGSGGEGPHMGRCGDEHCWATRGGQHQESKSVMGAQWWSAAEVDDLPWAGVLKGGLRSLRGIVLGHLARTRMLGFLSTLGWLACWRMLWSWCI